MQSAERHTLAQIQVYDPHIVNIVAVYMNFSAKLMFMPRLFVTEIQNRN